MRPLRQAQREGNRRGIIEAGELFDQLGDSLSSRSL